MSITNYPSQFRLQNLVEDFNDPFLIDLCHVFLHCTLSDSTDLI